MRTHLFLILVAASEANAERAIAVHAGGGIPTDQSQQDGHDAGEISSLLVGAALRLERADRSWSPRYEVAVRWIDGGPSVGIGDFTDADEPRGLEVRALAGLRVQSRRAALQGFAQLSGGLAWQRATWEEESFSPAGRTSNGTQHRTGLGLVLEPALGGFANVGTLRTGVQVALVLQATHTAMPIPINDRPGRPIDLLFTVFVEKRL